MSDYYDPDDDDPFVVVWEGPTFEAQALRMRLEEGHVPVELGDVPTPGEARVMVPRSYLSEVKDVISGTAARWPSVSVQTERGLDVDPRLRLAFVVMAAVVVVVLVLQLIT